MRPSQRLDRRVLWTAIDEAVTPDDVTAIDGSLHADLPESGRPRRYIHLYKLRRATGLSVPRLAACLRRLEAEGFVAVGGLEPLTRIGAVAARLDAGHPGNRMPHLVGITPFGMLEQQMFHSDPDRPGFLDRVLSPIETVRSRRDRIDRAADDQIRAMTVGGSRQAERLAAAYGETRRFLPREKRRIGRRLAWRKPRPAAEES